VTTTVKDRGLWLTLAGLTVLVLVLAVLQYRWVSELGRAEGQRRQAQLERAAWRFVRAFDRELVELVTAFLRAEAGQAPAGDARARLLAGLAAWRANEQAPLVSEALLAAPTPSGDLRLEAVTADGAALRETTWMPDLEPSRERLRAALGGKGFFGRTGVLLDPPLALAFPLVAVDHGAAKPGHGPFRVTGIVVLRLDPAYVRERLLPQIAEATFGPLAESEFVVGVVRRAERSLVFSSDPLDGVSVPRPGDVERSIPGRWGRGEDEPGRPGDPRPDVAAGPPPGLGGPGAGPPRGWGGAGPPGELPPEAGPGPRRGGPSRPPQDDGPWLLVARHRGGPLEVTVARVRRRNLAAGLGVLALLGATAAVLATGAQRARRLARQQMEFVAGVTHELNTPLAAIRSAGQNLADGIVTDPAQVRRYGGLIEKEGSRLGALVAQVLDFAGIESGNRAYASEPLSVAALVDDVLRDHRLVLDQAGMAVECSVAPGLPDIRGDAAALRTALGNLVSNAAKFARSGRWVGVRASAAPGGRAVVLRVEDRGPGIPRDERGRVFEPFYRGPAAERNAAPGSGLGLSLVRHVVGAHRGSVRVEGRDGGGAAVVVELPAAGDGGR
jgi:signal transduction histidine kinase